MATGADFSWPKVRTSRGQKCGLSRGHGQASWVFCDRCGCSVDTDLIHPDGHHYADDGDFYCVNCWQDDD